MLSSYNFKFRKKKILVFFPKKYISKLPQKSLLFIFPNSAFIIYIEKNNHHFAFRKVRHCFYLRM